jgi:hypothetical protein
VPLCALLLGRAIVKVELIPMVATAVLACGTLFLLLRHGDRRGFAVLWMLLTLLWIVGLVNVLSSGDFNIVEAGKRVPALFTIWNFAGFPLLLVTEYVLSVREIRHVEYRRRLLVSILWLGILIISSRLGSYALDVLPNPLQNPVVIWGAILGLVPAPFVLAWWFICRLSRNSVTVLDR